MKEIDRVRKGTRIRAQTCMSGVSDAEEEVRRYLPMSCLQIIFYLDT